MCSFCNQRYITGTCKAPHGSDVEAAVKTAVESGKCSPENTEIAFFGGSFTAINRTYMVELLKTASAFVEDGIVSGIRISTRPDAIDNEILGILKKYHVTSIELGAQSMDDRVLKMNNRGHTAEDVVNASRLIKEEGFGLGLQMMTGLYGDSDGQAVKTAEEIISVKPDTVRIYPTIVLKGTDLAALYADGIYRPQTLDKAVRLASGLYCMFENAGVRVIRLGLHSIEKDAYIAGPWHPAFSELCQSQIMLNRLLVNIHGKGKYTVFVSPSSVSKMIGQSRKNIIFLKTRGYDCIVQPDDSIKGLDLKVRKEV